MYYIMTASLIVCLGCFIVWNIINTLSSDIFFFSFGQTSQWIWRYVTKATHALLSLRERSWVQNRNVDKWFAKVLLDVMM